MIALTILFQHFLRALLPDFFMKSPVIGSIGEADLKMRIGLRQNAVQQPS